MESLVERVRRAASRLFAGRGARYWITALVVFILASWAAPSVDNVLNLTKERYWLFEQLSQSVTNPRTPRSVKLVLIGDKDLRELARSHRPTAHEYLGDLVRALDNADASVIALDFDVPLNPGPQQEDVGGAGGSVIGHFEEIPTAQRLEANNLVSAIDEVAQRRPIVLSKTVWVTTDGQYSFANDVYQVYGICSDLKSNGQWNNPGAPPKFRLTPDAQRNISCGYIALMADKRKLSPPVPTEGNSGLLDSFPLAIVRAHDGGATPSIGQGAHYVSFIDEDLANDTHTSMHANDLLHDPAGARRLFQGRPVIVGADWHATDSSGHLVDEHGSPVGTVVGAVIHENLAEALMSDRVFPELAQSYRFSMEGIIGLIAAFIFAYLPQLWMKVASMIAAMLVLFAIEWLVLQLAGAFFDAYIPVLALGLHAVIDRVVEGGRTGATHA